MKFDEGELMEGMEWELIVPYHGTQYSFSKLCRHAEFASDPIPRFRTDGSQCGTERLYTLPAGIAACWNEGGYNGTRLCLACLDDARSPTRPE